MTIPPPPEFPAADPGMQGFPEQQPGGEQSPPPGWGQPVFQAPTLLRKSRKHWYFGLGGLVIGLVAGLLMGVVGGAVGGELASSSAIPNSVEKCSAADTTGVDVMDNGMSMNLRTAGKKSDGATMLTVVCVLTELEAPDSLLTRLDSTRALDGTQTGEWAGFSASWTYHPDNGLNIILESAKK